MHQGKHLGLAFQIVDDILDFTQTEEQLGKTARSGFGDWEFNRADVVRFASGRSVERINRDEV